MNANRTCPSAPLHSRRTRREITQTVTSEAEMEAELRELFAALAA